MLPRALYTHLIRNQEILEFLLWFLYMLLQGKSLLVKPNETGIFNNEILKNRMEKFTS